MFIAILDGTTQHNIPHRGVYVLSRQRRSATNPDGLCNDLDHLGCNSMHTLDILVRARIEFAVFTRRTDAEYFLFARPASFCHVQQQQNTAPISPAATTPPTNLQPMEIIPGTTSTSARNVLPQTGVSSSTATPATSSTFTQNCQCNSPCQCEILDIVASIPAHELEQTDHI